MRCKGDLELKRDGREVPGEDLQQWWWCRLVDWWGAATCEALNLPARWAGRLTARAAARWAAGLLRGGYRATGLRSGLF